MATQFALVTGALSGIGLALAEKLASREHDLARSALSGEDHVYAASVKIKVEGMLANAIPGSVKGPMHEKMCCNRPILIDIEHKRNEKQECEPF